MAAGDLTTLAEVKTYLAITNSTADALLQQLITAASAAAINYFGRNILTASYTDVVDGNGAPLLPLPQYPITSVSVLKINDQLQKAQAQFADGGFVFKDRWLIFPNESSKFALGYANINVTYVAGYATVPADLSQAMCEVVAANWKTKDMLGWTSKSLAGESITVAAIDTRAYSPRVAEVLSNYKDVLPI